MLSGILGAPLAALAGKAEAKQAETAQPETTTTDAFVRLPWEPSDLPTFPEPPVEGSWATGFGWGSGDVSEAEQASVRADGVRRVARLSKHTRMASIHRRLQDWVEEWDNLPEPNPSYRIAPSIHAFDNGWRAEPPEFAVGGRGGSDGWRSFQIVGESDPGAAIRYSVNDGRPQTLPFTGPQFLTIRLPDGAIVKFWTDTPNPSHFQAPAAVGNVIVPLRWLRPPDDLHPRALVEQALDEANDRGFAAFIGPRLRGELKRHHGPALGHKGDK